MSLHHGLAVLTNTCFALLPMVYSCMVPGNLPSQLEILYTGQTYYETKNGAHPPRLVLTCTLDKA